MLLETSLPIHNTLTGVNLTPELTLLCVDIWCLYVWCLSVWCLYVWCGKRILFEHRLKLTPSWIFFFCPGGSGLGGLFTLATLIQHGTHQIMWSLPGDSRSTNPLGEILTSVMDFDGFDGFDGFLAVGQNTFLILLLIKLPQYEPSKKLHIPGLSGCV